MKPLYFTKRFFIFKLQIKYWKIIHLPSVDSLTDSSGRQMLLYSIWSLSPGSGLGHLFSLFCQLFGGVTSQWTTMSVFRSVFLSVQQNLSEFWNVRVFGKYRLLSLLLLIPSPKGIKLNIWKMSSVKRLKHFFLQKGLSDNFKIVF